MSSTAAVPRSTTLTSLRARQAAVARHVTVCEANVESLRSELALPPVVPGGTPPAERAMISAVRDLVEARARLAQVSRELRGVEGEKPAPRRYVR
jgi:uncharacterized protein involved in exopolysaccharide biosynthesis